MTAKKTKIPKSQKVILPVTDPLPEFASSVGFRELFDIESAAVFASVSSYRIKQWINEGLPHVLTTDKEPGDNGPKGIIIFRTDLLAFVAALRVRHAVVVEKESSGSPRAGKARDGKPTRRRNSKRSPDDDPFSINY